MPPTRRLRRFRRGLVSILAAVAAILFVTGAELTRLDVGDWKVSAYLSVLVAGFVVIIFALEIGEPNYKEIVRKRFQGPQALLHSLLLGYWIYVTLSGVRLFNIEAAQSVIVTTIFCLGAIVFAEFAERVNTIRINKIFALAGTLSGGIFLANLVVGALVADFNPGWLDPPSYAMVLVLSLAVVLGRVELNSLWWLGVVIILLALTFSSTRMPTLAAWIVVTIYPLLSGAPWRMRIVSAAIAWAVSGALIVLSYVFYPPNALRFQNHIPEVEVPIPGTGASIILGSSGRFGAWKEFLGMPASPLDWGIGLGAGASANYGRANIPYFPQTLNEYLRILIDFGAVGLMLFMALVALLLVTFYNNRQIFLSKVAFMALTGSLVIAITDGQFIYPFVVLPLAALLGFGLDGNGAKSSSGVTRRAKLVRKSPVEGGEK